MTVPSSPPSFGYSRKNMSKSKKLTKCTKMTHNMTSVTIRQNTGGNVTENDTKIEQRYSSLPITTEMCWDTKLLKK